jgi:hypothetical protein
MNLKHNFVVVAVALVAAGAGSAKAGETIDEAGAIVCVVDKWDEKEAEKGHKLVDYAGRCVKVSNLAGGDKVLEECAGKYEYMPDESWKGLGSCTRIHPGGDKTFDTWEEKSGMKAYPYKVTGGTGKFEGASGGGTYFHESLTDTLSAGAYNGKVMVP